MKTRAQHGGEGAKPVETKSDVAPALRFFWPLRVGLAVDILSLFLVVLGCDPVADSAGKAGGVLILFFFAINWRFVWARLREMRFIEGAVFPWILIIAALKADTPSLVLLCCFAIEWLVITVAGFVGR